MNALLTRGEAKHTRRSSVWMSGYACDEVTLEQVSWKVLSTDVASGRSYVGPEG